MLSLDYLAGQSSGMLQLGGARMALLDVGSGFWGLRRQIEALLGEKLTNSVLQQAGANGGASFAKSFVTTINQSDAAAFSSCLQMYQAAGFGQFEITSLQWPVGRICIQANQAFEAWMMAQNRQSSDVPCCAYTAGVLVGFVNVIGNRQDVVCIEHTCQSKGDDVCSFELLPASHAHGQTVVPYLPDPGLGRRLNLLEILFERMPMGIAILDRDYRVQRYNPTWGDYAKRYAPPSAAPLAPGVQYFDHLPGTESTVRPLFERVLSGETVRQDGLRLESDGMVTYWDVVLAPLVEAGTPVAILSVTVDATERVLLQLNLEQRVEERLHELNTLLEISQDITSTLELRPLLDMILDRLKTVVDYTGASILALDDDELEVRAHRGPIPTDERQRMRFPLRKALVNRRVIQRREPVIIADVRDDSPVAHMFRQTVGDALDTASSHVRSWLGVPLVVKGTTQGMLALTHDQPNYYANRHIKSVQTFANQVAVAIENARLYQAEQDRQRELRVLLDVAATANSSLDLDEMLARTLDLVVDLLGASRAGVLLVDEHTGGLMPHTLRPERAIAPDDLATMVQACSSVIASGEMLYMAPDASQSMNEPGALLPLQVRDWTLGVLAIIGRHGGTFTSSQLTLFKSVADQLSVAIENARLFEEAEATAIVAERNRLARDLHDAVTQTLFSSSLIAEVLPRIWKRDPEEGQRRLDELRQLTRGALSEMRTLLVELRPAALADTDLGDLIGHQVNAFNARTRVPVTYDRDCAQNLQVEVKETFYRVAQEALNNIAKHAEPTSVAVGLACRPGSAELVIQDNGVGFDIQSVTMDGLGLGIMQERARNIGAQLEIHSQIREGTRLRILWQDANDGERNHA